jgi:hypothetical protein
MLQRPTRLQTTLKRALPFRPRAIHALPSGSTGDPLILPWFAESAFLGVLSETVRQWRAVLRWPLMRDPAPDLA